MRTRALVIAVGLALAATACSGSSDASSDATTTTKAATTTTQATTTTASTTTTAPGPTTTTKPIPPGPLGDEKLVPLLLEAAAFGPDQAVTDSSDSEPKKQYCDGVDFTVLWQASATIAVQSTNQDNLAGASESLLEFKAGDATKWMDDFADVNKRCEAANSGTAVTLTPLPGYGDEAFKGVPPKSSSSPFPIEVDVVRVGDVVIVLFGISQTTAILTPALIRAATDKVLAG